MKSCFTINMHFSTIVRKDKNCAFFDGAISKQLPSVHCASTPIDHLAFWPRRPACCFYICHIPNGKVQTHYWLKLNHSCFSWHLVLAFKKAAWQGCLSCLGWFGLGITTAHWSMTCPKNFSVPLFHQWMHISITSGMVIPLERFHHKTLAAACL